MSDAQRLALYLIAYIWTGAALLLVTFPTICTWADGYFHPEQLRPGRALAFVATWPVFLVGIPFVVLGILTRLAIRGKEAPGE